MRVAAQNVELSITDADVDEKGQLINIESTLNPFAPAVQAMVAELLSLLDDDQLH
jgi:hypothetical protein